MVINIASQEPDDFLEEITNLVLQGLTLPNRNRYEQQLRNFIGTHLSPRGLRTLFTKRVSVEEMRILVMYVLDAPGYLGWGEDENARRNTCMLLGVTKRAIHGYLQGLAEKLEMPGSRAGAHPLLLYLLHMQYVIGYLGCPHRTWIEE